MSDIFEIFQDIDSKNDNLIQIKGFVKTVLGHCNIEKYLDNPSVYLPSLDRTISLR